MTLAFAATVPSDRRPGVSAADNAATARCDDDTATAPDQVRPGEIRHDEGNVEFASMVARQSSIGNRDIGPKTVWTPLLL